MLYGIGYKTLCSNVRLNPVPLWAVCQEQRPECIKRVRQAHCALKFSGFQPFTRALHLKL